MNLRTLWLAVALGAAPLVAHAQVSADVSFNWSTNAPGEPVASTDVFYDQLSPYGTWVDDPVVGEAFIPDESNYVPYTNGHWEDTDVGFVWASDEPFAWATSHYGRWWYSSDYGRWLWVPDTTWGPSWVQWYDAGNDLGWAPLAPDAVIDAGYQMPVSAYHYCPGDHILDSDVRRYYEPPDRVQVIHRQAHEIAHRSTIGSHQVIAGPDPQRLAAHHVRAQVKRVDEKVMGRMSATEARTAQQRAEQRKPQLEQQNAKRLQSHAELEKAVQQRAAKAPTRPATENHVNDVDRKDRNATPPATPNAATPRPDVNRRDENREPSATMPNVKAPTRTTRPAQKEPARTETTRPAQKEPARTETTRPEATTPRPAQKEPARTETTRPEATTPRPAQKEPARTETTRPEPTANLPRPTPQKEPARTEPTRPEPTANLPRPTAKEPARTETTRPEPTRAEPASRGNTRGRDKTDDKKRQ